MSRSGISSLHAYNLRSSLVFDTTKPVVPFIFVSTHPDSPNIYRKRNRERKTHSQPKEMPHTPIQAIQLIAARTRIRNNALNIIH